MSEAKHTSGPWNAGTGKGWIDKRGYRWLYVEENGRRRARREHRVVMEKYVGRRLEPWEIVHHKDGDTANNSIDNLEIQEWGAHTTHHHLGGRKSEDARRSMEAFALMREELKHERAVKRDLLAELQNLVRVVDGTLQGYGIIEAPLESARKSIAKATEVPA